MNRFSTVRSASECNLFLGESETVRGARGNQRDGLMWLSGRTKIRHRLRRAEVRDDLSIAVHPPVETWGQALPGTKSESEPQGVYVNYVKSAGRWEIHHQLYTATATSTLPSESNGSNFDAQNVAGTEFPWAEAAADDGVGESLMLKIKEPRRISRIGIRTGFVGNRNSTALYYANNRVAEFAVSINGAAPFTARIPDEPLQNKHFFISLPPGTPTVKDIKLTIQKVYRGEKFRDTCVSQIILVTPLNKGPKIEPVR